MKKTFLLIFSIFLFIFISCSNNESVDSSELEIDTLKTVLKDKDDFTLWTKELESELLSQEIRNEEFKLGSNIDFSSEIFNILTDKKSSIYPDLYGFGSLNTSALTEGVLNKINEFIKSVSSNPYSEKDEYFEKKYLFNYVFFLNDLLTNYEKNTGVKLPLKEDYEEKKSESTEDTKNEVTVPAIFTKWVLGEPFISEEIIQVPARIYYRKNYIDVNIYLKKNQSYNIYNVNIIRWG